MSADSPRWMGCRQRGHVMKVPLSVSVKVRRQEGRAQVRVVISGLASSC
jgi:hypothetical protein